MATLDLAGPFFYGFSRTLGTQLLEGISHASQLAALRQHFTLFKNHFHQLKATLCRTDATDPHRRLEGQDRRRSQLPARLAALPGPHRDWFAERQAAVEAALLDAPRLDPAAEDPKDRASAAQGPPREAAGAAADPLWKAFFRDKFFPNLERLVQEFHEDRPLPGAIPEAERMEGVAASTAAHYGQVVPNALHLWLRLAEEMLALRVVVLIDEVMSQLRNQMKFITLSILLMVLALSLYPFQPHRFLLLLSWITILCVVGTLVEIVIEMNRDEVLSRIGKSEPGKVTWDWEFISHLVFVGVVPVLSLLAAQFPDASGQFFSWVEPVLHTLNR